MRGLWFLFFSFAVLSYYSQDSARVETVAPITLETIQGQWFVQYSNFPKWLKSKIRNPSFNYTIQEKNGIIVLNDLVQYSKIGKRKKIRGFDTPTDKSNTRFVWQGRGALKILKSKWSIVYISPGYNWMIIAFEKTLFTPKGYDVISKERIISEYTSKLLFTKLEELGINKLVKRVNKFEF